MKGEDAIEPDGGFRRPARAACDGAGSTADSGACRMCLAQGLPFADWMRLSNPCHACGKLRTSRRGDFVRATLDSALRIPEVFACTSMPSLKPASMVMPSTCLGCHFARPVLVSLRSVTLGIGRPTSGHRPGCRLFEFNVCRPEEPGGRQLLPVFATLSYTSEQEGFRFSAVAGGGAEVGAA